MNELTCHRAKEWGCCAQPYLTMYCKVNTDLLLKWQLRGEPSLLDAAVAVELRSVCMLSATTQTANNANGDICGIGAAS